jgi:hypothetical protein
VALFLRNLDLRRILKLTSPFNEGNGIEWTARHSVLYTQMDSEAMEKIRPCPLPVLHETQPDSPWK